MISTTIGFVSNVLYHLSFTFPRLPSLEWCIIIAESFSIAMILLIMKSSNEVTYGTLNLTGTLFKDSGQFYCRQYHYSDVPVPISAQTHKWWKIIFGWLSSCEIIEFYNPCMVYQFNDLILYYC